MPFSPQNEEEVHQFMQPYLNPESNKPRVYTIISPLFTDFVKYLNKKEEDNEEKLNQMEEKFIQKINSQEKEIEFLKKTALCQEIKINNIETIVNKWLIILNPSSALSPHTGRVEIPKEIVLIAHPNVGNLNGVLNIHIMDIQDYRLRLFKKEAIRLAEAQAVYDENIRKSAADAVEKKKQEDEKAKTEKAIKDMMARVALLEETAKKEELELENLKLISDNYDPEMDQEMEEIEITEMQRLMVREANALARAAEMRAEQAKLRGTQKHNSPSSSNPSTWSKEKAEKFSQMWCE